MALQLLLLLLLVKDTKFESKSQLKQAFSRKKCNCFYWSKIQNLKANHNTTQCSCTKICIAFTGQRYKIWKQITTERCTVASTLPLLLLVKDTKFESKSQHARYFCPTTEDCFYWSKIQNLKANHNTIIVGISSPTIAFTGQRYKIWKQITTR